MALRLLPKHAGNHRLILGYLVTYEWLVHYGHHVLGLGGLALDVLDDAGYDITKRAGCGATVVVKFKGTITFCIGLVSNRPGWEGKLPPPEKYEQIPKLLGQEDLRPRWFLGLE